jgi:pyridinium-3,5-bisthiocarboxylic acid mononucleotide nickel chelatase
MKAMRATERILYFDCFSGICGDMTLAALVDLGVPEEHLRSELEKLGLRGWRLRFTPSSKNGIGGTRADVDLLPTPVKGGSILTSPHAAVGALGAAVGVSGVAARGGSHDHRAYRDIRAMIEASALPDSTKARALAIFGVLAEAEAKVHGTSVEEVGFHEVGAVDSIVDIVGAAICLDYLKPDRVLSSTVELGGGFVKCQHGLIPVPAPAVVELLKGVPVKSGAVMMETTTPTGAAVLAASVDEFTDDKRFRITRTAYGVGHRDAEIPNLLRVMLGERDSARSAAPGARSEGAAGGRLLECNVDDMSPEFHGYLFERLFSAGADDVWITPIVMKKNRSAVTLSAICGPDKEDDVISAMLRETSTFGLRRSTFNKTSLDRDVRTVATSLGEVRVKTGYLGGAAIKSKPEYEDLKRIADERGMSLLSVLDAIRKDLE